MDEALRGIWPEGKSHAEPQRLIWSGGFAVKMLEHFCQIWANLLMDEALRVIGPEGKSHAEPQTADLAWLASLSFLFHFLFGSEDG